MTKLFWQKNGIWWGSEPVVWGSEPLCGVRSRWCGVRRSALQIMGFGGQKCGAHGRRALPPSSSPYAIARLLCIIILWCSWTYRFLAENLKTLTEIIHLYHFSMYKSTKMLFICLLCLLSPPVINKYLIVSLFMGRLKNKKFREGVKNSFWRTSVEKLSAFSVFSHVFTGLKIAFFIDDVCKK